MNENKNNNMNNKKKFIHTSNIILLLCSLCWMGLIFCLSSQNGSITASASKGISKKIADIVFGTPSANQYVAMDAVIRRGAHYALFFGYGILTALTGISLFRNVNRIRPIKDRKSRIIRYVIFVITLIAIDGIYAHYDEWHKQFIAGRHYQLDEVMMNFEGAMVALALVLLVDIVIQMIKRNIADDNHEDKRYTHLSVVTAYTIIGVSVSIITLTIGCRVVSAYTDGNGLHPDTNGIYTTIDGWNISNELLEASNNLEQSITQMKAEKDAADELAKRYANAIPASSINRPAFGDYMCNIVIESVGINVPLYYGDSDSILAKGAGQYANGMIPGFPGLTMIAAHNQPGQFGELGNISIGDKVNLNMSYGDYTYVVTDAKVVEATDRTAYDLGVQEDKLIIYTCYPMYYRYSTSQRYFVYCDRVEGNDIRED